MHTSTRIPCGHQNRQKDTRKLSQVQRMPKLGIETTLTNENKRRPSKRNNAIEKTNNANDKRKEYLERPLRHPCSTTQDILNQKTPIETPIVQPARRPKTKTSRRQKFKKSLTGLKNIHRAWPHY